MYIHIIYTACIGNNIEVILYIFYTAYYILTTACPEVWAQGGVSASVVRALWWGLEASLYVMIPRSGKRTKSGGSVGEVRQRGTVSSRKEEE